ncbi:MAG: hypothetical protein PWQ57_1476 [Desulfovibrionales bacterium]|jgi:hypothetical protein|nr:hypothetical protein [Desulfovibrionales bacterium]
MKGSERKLYCTEDLAHGEFYLETTVTKSYRFDAKKNVVDETEYEDDPDLSGDIRCFVCGAPVVDWSRSKGLRERLVQLLYNLLKKDASYAKDPEVRNMVQEFLLKLVDHGLFLKRSINEKIPMKALLTKYGLTRAVVDYCKTHERQGKEEAKEQQAGSEKQAEGL